jgi:uncharacterized protein
MTSSLPMRLAIALLLVCACTLATLPAIAAPRLPSLADPLGASSTARSAQADVLPAVDYTEVEGLSQSVHETDTEVVVLEMRDGVEIYMEITRPKGDGRYPVILEASPYHGTIADRVGSRIFPDPKGENGEFLGLTGYFAPRGYAVVMMGLRGTGRSTGCLDHMGQADALDMVEVIEWINQQDWSLPRIGMTGHSYVGSTPMIVAAKQPAGLVTIVPSAGIARAYDHQFQDGVAYRGQYLGLPAAYNLLALDAQLPGGDANSASPVSGVCGLTTSSIPNEGHRQVTGEMGPFHAQRDHTEGATAFDGSVFMVQGTYDVAVRPPAMRWFDARKDPRDKLWYGQWDHGSGVHPNRRFEQWVGALHAWFDAELQQRDVETGPPVEVFVNGERTRSAAISAHEEVYTDTAWPPPSAQSMVLYPTTDGTLSETLPATPGVVTARGSAVASLRQNAEFVTDEFEEDTLLVGTPRLDFAGTFTSQNLDLIINVYEEDPTDGSRREISQFSLNPALRNSIENAQPVIPGVRYDLVPPGWNLAHEVPEGHRLVMRVTTVDPDKMGINTEDAQIGIITGRLGTTLRLPVIPNGVLQPDPRADAE